MRFRQKERLPEGYDFQVSTRHFAVIMSEFRLEHAELMGSLENEWLFYLRFQFPQAVAGL